MNQSAFIHEVTLEGYAEAVIVTREANGSIGDHSHPFAAKALILEGEIRIVVKNVSTTYLPGDLFQLDVGTLHQEYYGPQGVSYLVGRRA